MGSRKKHSQKQKESTTVTEETQNPITDTGAVDKKDVDPATQDQTAPNVEDTAAASKVAEGTTETQISESTAQKAPVVSTDENAEKRTDTTAPVAVVETPVVPAVESAPAAAVAETSEQTSSTVEETQAASTVDDTSATDPWLADIEKRLNSYIAAMGSNVMQNEFTGSAQQAALLRTYRAILAGTREQATVGLNLLLQKFLEQRHDVFSPTSINRFSAGIKISRTDLSLFHHLNNLFMVTADPKSRLAALKQIDLRKITVALGDDSQGNNLMEFYTPSPV